jgi:hypothetical protein
LFFFRQRWILVFRTAADPDIRDTVACFFFLLITSAMSVEPTPQRPPALELPDWARSQLKLAASDATLSEAALVESCDRIDQAFAGAAAAASAALPPDEINEFLSILLARAAHQDGNVAVAACRALYTLATANVGCLASHRDVGHLFNLLCPFQPPSTHRMRLFELALNTVFSTLRTVDAVNARNALVANGLISVVMRFLVHYLVVKVPRAPATENVRAGPEGRTVAPSECRTPFSAPPAVTAETASFDYAEQMTRLLAALLGVQLRFSVVAPMLPVIEQLMIPRDEDGKVVGYACRCAAAILCQSPKHRAACEAAIAPQVFALVKHATAVALRAGFGAAAGTAVTVDTTSCGSNSAPATTTTTSAPVVAIPAAPQAQVDHVSWQPSEYLVSALSFLAELSSTTDTNIVRTVLMLLASLRKLPQTPPVLSAIENALGFLMRNANGSLEKRHVLIDGGMLNTGFDMLAHLGHGDPDVYVGACNALFFLVVPEPRKGASSDASSDTAPIIHRVLAAAFAYGAVNDQHVPVPLWNFANGVAGYPAEIAALVAAKRVQRLEGGAHLDGSAEEQAGYADTVVGVMAILMEFGLNDGSDFTNGRGTGKACGNPQSWWHALFHRMRALLKNSRRPAAVDLLRLCAAATVVTAETNRGSKGRFR